MNFHVSKAHAGAKPAQQHQQPRITDCFIAMGMQQHGGGVALTDDMRAGNEALRQQQFERQMEIQHQNQGCPAMAEERARQQMGQQPQI
ncbi:MAG: hypothetical protein J0L77_07750 [Alphaproteobacteria bacterium]|nr:hypothetical protein [Alphaproteobacteria bacterium]